MCLPRSSMGICSALITGDILYLFGRSRVRRESRDIRDRVQQPDSTSYPKKSSIVISNIAAEVCLVTSVCSCSVVVLLACSRKKQWKNSLHGKSERSSYRMMFSVSRHSFRQEWAADLMLQRWTSTGFPKILYSEMSPMPFEVLSQ